MFHRISSLAVATDFSDLSRAAFRAAATLAREFGAGDSADQICARSIRALRAVGVQHFYISNLPLGRAAATLRRILALSEAPA